MAFENRHVEANRQSLEEETSIEFATNDDFSSPRQSLQKKHKIILAAGLMTGKLLR
jgi:hypothetical protein